MPKKAQNIMNMNFAAFKPVLMDKEGDGAAGGVLTDEIKTFVNDSINGALKNFMKKDLAKHLETALSPLTEKLGVITTALESVDDGDGGSGDGGAPAGGGTGGDGKPAMDAETRGVLKRLEDRLKATESQLANEKTLRETAEKNAKESNKAAAVRGALQDFVFANPETKEDVFKLISADATFDDSGNLVAGELPLADYVKDYVGKRPNLLTARQVGGAGANQGGARGGTAPVDLDQLKPGAKPEVFAAAAREIRQALSAGQ